MGAFNMKFGKLNRLIALIVQADKLIKSVVEEIVLNDDYEVVIVQQDNKIKGVLAVGKLYQNFLNGEKKQVGEIELEEWEQILEDAEVPVDHILTSKYFVVVSSDGVPLGVVGKEELLRFCSKYFKSKCKELNAIIDASSDEIFVTNGEGTVVKINPASEKLLDVKAMDIEGKNVRELAQEGLFFPSCSIEVIKQKKSLTVLQTLKNGKQVITTANPVFGKNNQVFRVVVNSRDITELNALKYQLEGQSKLLSEYQSDILKLSKGDAYFNKDIVVGNEAMQKVFNLATKVAKLDCNVLIAGESGVGKEIIAETVHRYSNRKGALVKINCGAIPENLLESELFGYEKGAFTGADKDGKIGKIELAESGTLFLDEVGELSLNLQVKLLRFLQTKEITRLGGTKVQKIDCRIVAATNADLTGKVKGGTFREDLYYRLKVVPISIPPLRERPEDIILLTDFFLKKFNKKYNNNKKFAKEARDDLLRYRWPGNIRELENLIERLIITIEDDVIQSWHFPGEIICNAKTKALGISVLELMPIKKAVEEVELQLLEKALKRYKNTYKIAEVLECNQSTIVRKIQKYRKTFVEHDSLSNINMETFEGDDSDNL